MNTHWKIGTHGDPLGAVRRFIQTVWAQAELEGMLVPLNGNELSVTRPKFIADPKPLEEVNPFKPVMVENAARSVCAEIQEQPDAKLGTILRPCEMRALVEMVKRDSVDLDNLLTISVDCLGSFPADEFQWRAARKEASGGVTQDTIQFAKQGGILAYRYRSACQMCVSPQAKEADLNINIFGLPVRQHILITAQDQETTESLNLDNITDSTADEEMINSHERVLARMKGRLHSTMERVTQGLGDLLPQYIDAVIAQLESCGSCQMCMEACPLCAVNFPQLGPDNRYQREDAI